jgi:uroporphyrinogen decarboxylase
MNRRERVRKALNFEITDQIPKDLAGMRSTGISCYAYPKLVEALGLPYRRPRVYDSGQMLALPDLDVLDALDCDVCLIEDSGITNAFDQPEFWKPVNPRGDLDMLHPHPEAFSLREDGTAVQNWNGIESYMPPGSYVFDTPHGGQSLDLTADIFHIDLKKLEADLKARLITDQKVDEMAALIGKARQATDRALFFNMSGAGLGFPGGMAAWSMTCLLDPDHVHQVHAMTVEYSSRNLGRMLSAVGSDIDVIMLNADDQGTQNATILPPSVFRDLYMPYYKKVNDQVSRSAPDVFRFLHSCGAIYDIIDDIIEAGFQVLNPVQWTAGGHTPREWHEKTKGKLALWGGGVDSQSTLPLGTVEQVGKQAAEMAALFSQGGGYVFNNIHNLLAEIEPEKIIAMYREAGKVRA